MKKEILKEIKNINEKINDISKIYDINQEELNKLETNELVRKALKIMRENIDIKKNIEIYNNKIPNLITHNCSHELLLYKDYYIDMYDSSYEYQCIECGKIIESSSKMKNVINSNNAYKDIRKEYYNYLMKYDENIALQIMIAKYNDNMFIELTKNGLDEIRALKLVKNRKD